VLVWKSKINLRQKLLLTGVFLLVAFNIIVTIIRGSIFGGVYNSTGSDRKVLNVSWMLFWFYLEYITGKFAPYNSTAHGIRANRS
jgi:hypothetical protein